ncbi:MAG: hypothetical protein ACFE9M_01455 [Promethearchaeota archaeon]
MLLFLIPLFSNIIFTNSFINNSIFNIETDNLKTSGIEYHPNNDWIENPSFDGTGEPWISRIEGDSRDVLGNIALGRANYKIIGDSGVKRIDDPLNDTDWILYSNPDLPILPNGLKNITERGCEVSHVWDEDVNQTHNRPSVRWKNTIEMPVDMKDYIITSASLEVIFNATVTVDPHGEDPSEGIFGQGIDREGDVGLDDYSTGDYAEFYVLLSDVEESFPAPPVAYNHTGELGRDFPRISNYSDTPMDVVPEDVLISILTSILEIDGFNFTITLGIDIYCEDNEWEVDVDSWDSLIIRSFNLTFSYEKKINRFTSLSWEQVGDKIEGTNVQVTNANVSFKYKIDRPWPEIPSPNSEIRILINNNSIPEDAIKLSIANSSFQLAKEGGYDVTSLILKDINITLSIQVYLKDEFGLDQNITVSIDDVYLIISYIEIFPDFFYGPWVFAALLVFAIIATASIGGYLIAYQKVLKYPRPVRKVRKFRRTLNRSKAPAVAIMSQEVAFNLAFNHELAETSKSLKLKSSEIKEPSGTEKGAIEQQKEKNMEKKIDSEELIAKSLEKKEELDKIVEKLPEKPDS